jgi:hypothetical protein
VALKLPLAGLVSLGLSVAAGARAADQHEPTSVLDRPHTIAVVEGGIIALPNAPISPSNRGGSTPIGSVGNGDATIQTGIHLLYRPDRDWAVGAGAVFAPNPTSDKNYGGLSGLKRTHSRSYLFLGGEGRYFPFHSKWFDAWVGFTAGSIIIADRFTTNSGPAVPTFLGTPTETVSTEGFAIGGQLGADYLITDRLIIGLTLRADAWFLPREKPFSQETSCDPIGDCPTLTGTVAAFEGGIAIGYQIPL